MSHSSTIAVKLPADPYFKMTSLKPEFLNRFANLHIAVKTLADGIYAGSYRSPFQDSSAEFSDYRAYVPGDDIRMMDWRASAKSDRDYVRLSLQEKDRSCLLVLDASASMAYRGAEKQKVLIRRGWKWVQKTSVVDEEVQSALRQSKFEYGSLVAGVLGYLIIHRGDRVGVALVSDSLGYYQAPARGTQRLYTIINQMEAQQPKGKTELPAALKKLGISCKEKGLLIVVSDLITDMDELFRSLQSFLSRKFTVVLIHILTPEELHLTGFNEYMEFMDPESTARITTNLGDIGEDYRDEMSAWLHSIQTNARRLGISYSLISTGLSPDAAIKQLVLRINH